MKPTHLITIVFSLMANIIGVHAQTVVSDTLDFDRTVASSPAKMLQGRLAGVLISQYSGNPNGALNTSVRGTNSLRSDNQPLWIIDGAILGGSDNQNLVPFWQYARKGTLEPLNPMAFLSPYDIESIEVIKDASATALYGVRGANGVIIVRTRIPKGAERQVDWHSNIAYNGSIQHNHYLSVGGERNKFTYNISGFYRNLSGQLDRNDSDYGGVTVNFGNRGNQTVQIGVNGIFSLGSISNPSATVPFGEPSMTLARRNTVLSPGCTPTDWLIDYDDDTKEYRTVNSAYLLIHFTPYLNWKTILGMDFRNSNRYVWYGDRTEFGAANNGAAAILNSTLFNYNFHSVLDYGQYFAVNHHFAATLGVEMLGNSNAFNTMNGTDFFSKTLRAKGLSLMKSDVQNHKFSHDYFQWGLFATVAYDYKRLVGVDAVLRADFTAKYGSEPSWYPAVSAWWNVMPKLRLKAGYGIAGKELYVPYEQTSRYLTGSWPQVDADTGIYYDGLNRVRSTEYHAMIETHLLSERLRLSLSYYNRISEDAYRMYSFCDRSGKYLTKGPRKLQYARTSTVRNRGFEFELESRLISTKDVIWTLGANFTWNVNQIIRADEEDLFGHSIGSGLVASGNVRGYAAGAIIGYLLDANDDLVDYDGDGRISPSDMRVIGETQPEYFGALNTTLRWRRFLLDVQITGVGGNDLVNLNNLAANSETELHPGYVERGDYLRLARLSLQYDIPVRWKAVRSLTVSVSGVNLATFTRYSGYNPDVDSFGIRPATRGFDYGSYPQPRSVVLSVSAKF